MSEVVSLSAEPLDLPLVEPFEISLGTQYEASNVLVTVETESGVRGYGEASPIPPVTGETQGATLETVRTAAEVVEGRRVENYRDVVGEVRATFAGAPSATFAVETALLDAYCRERDVPLAELFGGSPSPVETDMTIGIMSSSEAAAHAERAVEAGFEHLKVKTGTDLDGDVERVVAIVEAAPEAALKVDANQGWTPKATVRFADRVAQAGVELDLIEQPVAKTDLAGLADVRRRVDVPIAADESVFTPADAIAVVREGAADVINVKLGKSGPLAVADIAAIARGADLELMVGCMLESALGIHTSAHVVAGLGCFEYVDLDGNLILERDVVETDGGPVHHVAGPGHGIVPEIP